MQRFLLQYENNVKIFSPENAPPQLCRPCHRSEHCEAPTPCHPTPPSLCHSEGAQQPRESPIPPFRPWDSFGASPLRMTSPSSPRHSAPPFCRSAPPFCHSAPPFCHSAPPFCHSAPPFCHSAPPFCRSAPPFCRSAPPFCRSAPPFCHSERSEESHERSPHPP